MEKFDKQFLQRVYKPLEISETEFSLAQALGHDRVFYYSYGRHALYEALKSAGIKDGNRVLVPEFICRDLLSAIHSVNAEVVFYPVKDDLTPLLEPGQWPEASAVLAVNYFGFPQNLLPFKKYCERVNAILIEDNAHGFLSRDENGIFLGSRGDVGVFSIRKTLPVYNGAALAFNKTTKKFVLPVQPQDCASSKFYRLKESLRRTVPLCGVWPIRLFTFFLRVLRKVRTGYWILPSDPSAEKIMPENSKPWEGLGQAIKSLDADSEVRRRRELYQFVDRLMCSWGVKPVFSDLESFTVPYVYPFFVDSRGVEEIEKKLKIFNLECFPWPEIPDDLVASVPDFYKRIYCVRFLW